MRIGSLNITLKSFLNDSIKESVIIADYEKKTAYKMLAVQIAASYIASAISKCEFKTYENNKITKDLNWYKLNVEPNINYNGSQFWYKVAMQMLTNRNGALVIISNDNLYCADSFSIDKHPFSGNLFTSIVVDDMSMKKSYKINDVLWFRLNDENIVNLIDSIYDDYGKALAYAMKSFLKVNGQKYKLKVATDKVGDKTFNEYFEETLKEQLKKFIDADTGVYPEHKGYSLETFDNKIQTKDSSDIVSLRKDTFEIVGQAYKIPKAMMEGNINNIKDVISSFITFAIQPIAEVITDEINRKIFGFEGMKKGYYAKVDTSRIPYASILDSADNASKLIANTICKGEEVRDILGLDYIDDEILKQFFVTKNNSKAEDVLNGTAE